MEITRHESAALEFINSNKFGIDTWTTIYLFDLNARNIILSIELYGVLIEKLDKDHLLGNYTTEDVIRIKQQIVLDVILKIQILIESSLVLIHTLSRGYHSVAKIMTYYDIGLVNSIIKEVRRNKKLKNYNFSIRKALGLPNLKHLSLSLDEKKFMNKDFIGFESKFLDLLKKLVSFYDKFNIVYGKSKHGLTFITGGADALGQTISFDNSVLQCYSRIQKENKIPREFLTSTLLNSTQPINYKYFNFLSIIKFDKKLFDEINFVIGTLKKVVSFVCANHEAYALNGGKGYLPHQIRDGKKYMLTSRNYENQNEKKIIKNIADKNLSNTYTPKCENVIKINYTNPQIVQSLMNKTITNIMIS
jgi:hypothetical protein